MALEILTKDDLSTFKTELFTEIARLIGDKKANQNPEYLKTWQVMKALNISKGKLQSMRASGKLPFTRIVKCIYFEYVDIKKILDENKIHHTPVGQGKNRFSLGK